MRNVSARIGAALALSVVLGVPGALGQTPPKKPAKGAPPTPATTPVADVAVTAPAPAVEVAVAPVAAPVEATPPPTPVAAAPKSDDELDVAEKNGQKYYFIGLRYRGQLIPQAFIDIFVQGGASVYTNSIGLELDMRKDGFSLIPNITYTDYGTGNLLFLQQGKSGTDVGNWSMVNSSLKVLYFGADFLWSAKIAKNFDFEYGLGFGIGVVFGELVDNWVQAAKQGTPFTLNGQPGTALSGSAAGSSYASQYYIPCVKTGPLGCNDADHMDSNTTTPKVNNYTEPHGFNPVPSLFFNVSIPYIGVRIKPIKSFEGRLGIAFNIPNGIVFGFSGDYGLEKLLQSK
jgi:hypothetical protein